MSIYLGLVEGVFRVYPGLVLDLSGVGAGPIQDWFKVCLVLV